jgi:hypothetical protein
MTNQEWFLYVISIIGVLTVLALAGMFVGFIYALGREALKLVMLDVPIGPAEKKQLDSICAATGKSREEVLREALGQYANRLLVEEAQAQGFYALLPPSRTAEDSALQSKDKPPIEPA